MNAHARPRQPPSRHCAPPPATCFGIRYPIVQTGMGWVSTPELTAATANAGGLGILAGATLTVAETEAAIARTKELTAAPFGVNLRGDSPDLPERARLLIKHGVRVASFGLAPNESVIRELTKAGLVVMPSIGARRHAEKVAASAPTRSSSRAARAAGTPGASPPRSCCPRSRRRSASRCSARAASATAAGSSPRSPTAPRASRWAPGSCSPGRAPCPTHVKQEYLRRSGDRHRGHHRARRRAAAGAAHRARGPAGARQLAVPAGQVGAARGRVQEDVRHVLAGPDPRGNRHEDGTTACPGRGHHGREHPHDAPREHGRRADRPGHARQRAGRRASSTTCRAAPSSSSGSWRRPTRSSPA